jgi:glycosyltransferase involved in cell wall biosynthesis
MKSTSSLKVALVHDFLREYGGAERVIEALHELFPNAPLYVAFADPQAMGIHWQRFADWQIRQTWLSKLPLHKRLFSPLRVLAPAAFRSLDLSEYDVVISSSNAYFAKAIQVSKGAVHLCYCHPPPRALYGYSTMTDWKKNPLIRVAGTLINHVCRVMDVQSAQGVNVFIANSQEVQQRIRKFYRREAVIIHPPVFVPDKLPDQKRDYFLYVNRLAFAKHPELAVQVASKLKLPLKVVGTGKMLPELQQLAGSTVEFLGGVSDEQLYQLYAGARALLYPVEDEDFGIVPVEAMGFGVPVIAHRSGGPTETIIGVDEGTKKKPATGIFFDDLTVDGLKAAVELFLKHEQDFSGKNLHQHAQNFTVEHFKQEIQQLVTVSVEQAEHVAAR